MKDKKVKTYIVEYNMVYIMILSVVLLIIPVLMTWAYYRFTSASVDFNLDNLSGVVSYTLLFVLMILWMVLHEIIHGIAYQVNGAKKENITFGVALEKGIFYCKCGEFINKKNIIISLLSPFILIGVITLIIGYLINSFTLIFLSIVNISGAAGDLAMFGFFIKQDKDLRFKELGDSTTFCLKTKDDLSNKKFISVRIKKVVTDEKEIEEEKSKKINITKASWVILIVFILLIVLDFVLSLIAYK